MLFNTYTRDRLKQARFSKVIEAIESGPRSIEGLAGDEKDETARRYRDLSRHVAAMDRQFARAREEEALRRWASPIAKSEHDALQGARDARIDEHLSKVGPFADARELHAEVRLLELHMLDLQSRFLEEEELARPYWKL